MVGGLLSTAQKQNALVESLTPQVRNYKESL